MIVWCTGNTGAGKTTLARRLAKGQSNTVILDGDVLRTIWPGLTLEKGSREENCMRAARLAKALDDQGMSVIVAVIAPYEALRREIETVCGCSWVYLPDGAEASEVTPYEAPTAPDAIVRKE